MKNILLIGDSILVGSNQTSGYGTIVRDMLKDKANVYIPLDNARYTMYTLRNLSDYSFRMLKLFMLLEQK